MPDGQNEACSFIRCEKCNLIFSKFELEKSLFVCRNCGCHMKVSALQRISQLADPGSFSETNVQMGFMDPISFPGYEEKYLASRKKTNVNEAVLTGTATIEGRRAALGVMESGFIMGSMGVVLGEKVSQLFELGMKERCPVVMVTASGGARMQEMERLMPKYITDDSKRRREMYQRDIKRNEGETLGFVPMCAGWR